MAAEASRGLQDTSVLTWRCSKTRSTHMGSCYPYGWNKKYGACAKMRCVFQNKLQIKPPVWNTVKIAAQCDCKVYTMYFFWLWNYADKGDWAYLYGLPQSVKLKAAPSHLSLLLSPSSFSSPELVIWRNTTLEVNICKINQTFQKVLVIFSIWVWWCKPQ